MEPLEVSFFNQGIDRGRLKREFYNKYHAKLKSRGYNLAVGIGGHITRKYRINARLINSTNIETNKNELSKIIDIIEPTFEYNGREFEVNIRYTGRISSQD